jgi:hypothetical protein
MSAERGITKLVANTDQLVGNEQLPSHEKVLEDVHGPQDAVVAETDGVSAKHELSAPAHAATV